VLCMRCILNSETKWLKGRILLSILVVAVSSMLVLLSRLHLLLRISGLKIGTGTGFYHTVPMVEERDESRKIMKHYPLATKIGKNVFHCKPKFLGTKNSKICEKAYKLTASL